MKCAGRITVFTGLTGRFFVFQRRLLVGPQSVVLGSVRFLFERYQAGWISQQKVVESASSLNFMGIPTMRMTTASTAFKMPLYGISLPLSTFSEALTEASLYSRLAENAGYPIGELLLSFLSEAEQ